MTARSHRADELEKRLGDPYDAANPLGFGAILRADERAEMLPDGERALDDYGLNAEFVPPELGGRLHRLDDLVEVMRVIYRRDPCLGLGYGVSSFIAAVNVWTAAGVRHRQEVADLLLGGRKVSVAYHELRHGNDMARTECSLLPTDDGLVLNGRKEVVTNLQRSDAVVLFARTDPRPGSRSHSQVLLHKQRIIEDRMRYLPRFTTVGMRGVQLGGIEFDNCPLPADAILGTLGGGLETALRSFQITRTTLVAMFTGMLDTGLRVVLRHVRDRRLYGRTAADLPQVRAIITAAYADLLLCEAFALVATRAIHLVPRETAVYAQAVKFFVAGLLMDAMRRLSSVLGAHFYIRESRSAIFQKLLRDVAPAGFGHAARAACQVSLLPVLPLIARRSWPAAEPAPDALFRLDADLPPVPYDALVVSSGGRERLSSSLAAGLAALPDGAAVADLRRFAAPYLHEQRELATVLPHLPPGELSVAASPATYDLTHRYVNVLAAAACVELWRHNTSDPDPFLADPTWVTAALARLIRRPGATPAPLPDHLIERLWRELGDRFEAGHTFGLIRRQIPDRPDIS